MYLGETRDLAVLDIYRRHRNTNLRTEVARNPHATPEMLLELASDADEMVREVVAANPSCSEACIDVLLMDPVPRVTRELCKNPNLAPEVMREWVGKWRTADESLARNPNCPEDVMLRLAELGDYEACINLAGNPKTSVRVLELLAESEEESVRGAVAQNARMPLPTLMRLLRDADELVRCSALTHWLCPASFLVEASKSNSLEILECVTRHPRTPPRILASLADYKPSPVDWDPDLEVMGTTLGDVIVALASNPMVPRDVLLRLTAHEDDKVASAAQKNPARTFDDEDELWKTISVRWDPDQGKPVIHQPY